MNVYKRMYIPVHVATPQVLVAFDVEFFATSLMCNKRSASGSETCIREGDVIGTYCALDERCG